MKHRKNDRTKIGSASGIPSTSMMTSWLVAPTSEIAPVPIMYPLSTSNARLPAASTSPAASGRTREMVLFHRRPPSFRK